RTIARLAERATEGKVYGIDYADGSVAVARATNAKAIAAGRGGVRKAPGAQPPFPAATLDLVPALPTLYYWPNRAADMQEVFRVVKPGGALVVIAESYKGSRIDPLQAVAMKMLRGAHLSIDEHCQVMTDAGFTDVQAFEERSRTWLCVVG